MSIDQAVAEINAAPSGKAHETALRVINKLSEEDKLIAGGDIEEMAIVLDGE